MNCHHKHKAKGPKILLLGLGNDILSDDAIGLLVVRAIARDLRESEEIDVCETTEMGLALLDFLAGYDAALIVDSVRTGHSPPGTVHAIDAMNLRRLDVHAPHLLGVGETLVLGRQLGLAMPTRVTIAAVEVEDPYTVGTQLSAALAVALPEVLRRVHLLLQELLSALHRQTDASAEEHTRAIVGETASVGVAVAERVVHTRKGSASES
ncbi:MAG: hydrogenase maturation protease [Verrucomicrobiae bacterium]|nr:hydrogenase maturation protease [Verrucomicrobiae bacterium]